jgi:hypothetical protein
VLVAEVLESLALKTDGWYVDGTYGRGGHSAEILKRLGPQGRLLALDKDPEAVAHGRERFAVDPDSRSSTPVSRDFEPKLRRGWERKGWRAYCSTSAYPRLSSISRSAVSASAATGRWTCA